MLQKDVQHEPAVEARVNINMRHILTHEPLTTCNDVVFCKDRFASRDEIKCDIKKGAVTELIRSDGSQ